MNQLTSIGGSAMAHDARGNLTSDPTSGKTYGYSPENLLTSASGGVTLNYDPQMRLYQLAGAATTRFAYDELAMIAEYDGSNALQRRFVHGPRADEPLVQYEGTGTTDRRFLHADERGTIIATSDGSGAMLAINKYDEFGKPQSSNTGRFQYTGQMWLGEAGVYHYKARAYAPHLGRFLQIDPIGYEDSPNLYAYVGNDPVNLADPTGQTGEGSDAEAEILALLHRGRGSNAFGQRSWDWMGMTGRPTGGMLEAAAYERGLQEAWAQVAAYSQSTGLSPGCVADASLCTARDLYVLTAASNTPLGGAYIYTPTLAQHGIATIHLSEERYQHIFTRHGPHVTERGHFGPEFFSMGAVGFALQMRQGFSNMHVSEWMGYSGVFSRALQLTLDFGPRIIGGTGTYRGFPDLPTNTAIMRIGCYGSNCAVVASYPRGH